MKNERGNFGKALIFAVLFATLAFVSIGCASATTIYVPDNFSTIQQAVNNATDNEIIIVRDGIYTENVDVNVNHLTIKSENGSALTTSATTVTLCSEASLDGYIRGDDLVDSTSSMLIIGDNNVNKSHRIFVSFNLSSIPTGATIDSANLRLYHLLLSAGFHPHDAYTDLGHVVVDHVDYGSSLAMDDYGIAALASNIGTISTFAGWGWRELDVTSLVQYDIDNGRPRSQYRLRYYPLETDGDGLYDQNAFASNETPYSPPELVITYSLPELPVRNIDTSEDFSTIQAAIDAVNTTNGHTITVDPRIYNENVNVYKQLTIRSSSGSPADTIVQAADSNDHVFEVAADYVNISGFTLKGAAYNCGVHCKHESLVIINNIVTGNYWGIGCWDGASPNINNNMIKNNIVDGLYVYSSSPVIDKNTIVGNGRAGITLREDSSPRITNNSFINNTHGINCNYAIGTLTIISGNYIYENTDGIVIDGSSNSTINNNNISSNEYGIKLRYSSNNNTIYNNYFNNTNNAYDNGNNQWNITKTLGTNIIGGSYLGGNYWSDYAGEDSDGDGLGDTMHPYNSFGNIQNGGDYLPLTTPAVTPTPTPEATTVSISPSTKTISPGPFTVNVTVEPEVPIAGVQFYLSFNPSLLRANNVTEGNLLKQGGANTYFYSGAIDNAAGTITGVASAITTPGETVSTPTVFATIQMTAKSVAGTSTLDLSNVIVGDINGNAVVIAVNNGSVTISTASWDVNGDGFVNVLDMILVGQHFGETGSPGWIPEDVNRDGVINARDMVP